MEPLVSIILATYNGKEKWLSEAIESVLHQSYKNFEFIILNDASTNDIEKTILEYQHKDPRIIYLKNKENLKLTKTLNKGITKSKGKYIARIDDDDIWCDNSKLQKQIDFMENNPEYGICSTGIIITDEEGKEIKKEYIRKSDKDIRKNILQSNQLAHPAIIIRKEILDKVGGYNPIWNIVEDYELRLRIGKISKMYNIPEYMLKYRINNQGISRTKSFKQEILAFKAMRKHRKGYPNVVKACILRIGALLLPQQRIKKINFIKK